MSKIGKWWHLHALPSSLRDAANSDGGGRDYRVLVLSFDPQDTHRRKWQRNLLG